MCVYLCFFVYTSSLCLAFIICFWNDFHMSWTKLPCTLFKILFLLKIISPQLSCLQKHLDVSIV